MRIIASNYQYGEQNYELAVNRGGLVAPLDKSKKLAELGLTSEVRPLTASVSVLFSRSVSLLAHRSLLFLTPPVPAGRCDSA